MVNFETCLIFKFKINFLTLKKKKKRLNEKSVFFGQVYSGMDIVYKIESFGTSNGKTKKKIVIYDCGELN